MKELIKKIRHTVKFKETTSPGDIVLILAIEPKMMLYALVSEISRDTSRKDEWWNLDLLFLSIPPQTITWTLRSEQMTGQEVFTMGGKERFLQAIAVPDLKQPRLKKETKKSFIKRIK